MRIFSSARPLLRVGLLSAAIAVASGCSSSRPDPEPPPSSRVGLASSMPLPANPYGDALDVDVPPLPPLAAKAPDPYGLTEAPSVPAAQDVTVSRYYYDDQNTYYTSDAAPADNVSYDGSYNPDAYAYTTADDAYYGGYAADYYAYADPAFFASPFQFYQPFQVYQPYLQFGWAPTWNRRFASRRAWRSARFGNAFYDPYYFCATYYDPFFFDPFLAGPFAQVGFGFGGFGVGWGYGWGGGFGGFGGGFGFGGFGGGFGGGGFAYGAGYADGFQDGFFTGGSGPGYYGDPGLRKPRPQRWLLGRRLRRGRRRARTPRWCAAGRAADCQRSVWRPDAHRPRSGHGADPRRRSDPHDWRRNSGPDPFSG